MKQHTKSTIIGLSVFALTIGLFAPAVEVFAADNSGEGAGQALEIAPPVLNLTADPGQTINTQISLRDVSSSPLVVTGTVNDFVASGEDGTPKILMEEDEETSPYSLKDWVAPLSELLLQPRQIENLPVTINVPADAAPGGYFGVVRFTATPPELEGTGVSLSASLGALILLRVNGDAKEGMVIEEFGIHNGNGKLSSLFQSTPITFMQRLKNTGNVHQQPAGQVTIIDMFGKKVAAVNVNLPPRNILPQSIRKFEQKLDSSVIGNKQLFGRYTAQVRIVYGANKEVVTSETTFWVIPYTLIGIAVLALVAGFIALRIMIRRYNDHIIGKATGKKKTKKSSRKGK